MTSPWPVTRPPRSWTSWFEDVDSTSMLVTQSKYSSLENCSVVGAPFLYLNSVGVRFSFSEVAERRIGEHLVACISLWISIKVQINGNHFCYWPWCCWRRCRCRRWNRNGCFWGCCNRQSLSVNFNCFVTTLLIICQAYVGTFCLDYSIAKLVIFSNAPNIFGCR